MTLTVTPEVWAAWADGKPHVFALDPQPCPHIDCDRDVSCWGCRGEAGPPAWVLDALKPCVRCKGDGTVFAGPNGHATHLIPCPDCHNGHPKVEVRAMCTQCDNGTTRNPESASGYSPCRCHLIDGQRTIPLGYVTVSECLPINPEPGPSSRAEMVMALAGGALLAWPNPPHAPIDFTPDLSYLGPPEQLVRKFGLIVTVVNVGT